jgi:hypothetical protein
LHFRGFRFDLFWIKRSENQLIMKKSLFCKFGGLVRLGLQEEFGLKRFQTLTQCWFRSPYRCYHFGFC